MTIGLTVLDDVVQQLPLSNQRHATNLISGLSRP